MRPLELGPCPGGPGVRLEVKGKSTRPHLLEVVRSVDLGESVANRAALVMGTPMGARESVEKVNITTSL
jgi:hypothetical protein